MAVNKYQLLRCAVKLSLVLAIILALGKAEGADVLEFVY